ncbi:MAG: flavodoxin [Gammaproteobacteria bacterium]|nr:MAG: flavodoxin [Gammaproteobacteria bacterium]
MQHAHILYGSVYGTARDAAEQLHAQLRSQGLSVSLEKSPDSARLSMLEGALIIVTSTTGAGDVPDNLHPFLHWLETCPDLYRRPFALAGLGDSSYFDTFCGAAEQIQAKLEDLGANALLPSLKIDTLEHADAAAPLLAWGATLPDALRLSWQAA